MTATPNSKRLKWEPLTELTDISQDPIVLGAEFAQRGTFGRVVLPQQSAARTMAMLKRHRRRPYWPTLLEAVAAAEDVPTELLRRIVEGVNDPCVHAAVAVSLRVPDDLLGWLASSPSASVRGHAQLNQLQRRLPSLSESELFALLHLHSGDDGIALGARLMIASFPHTPVAVLKQLADDDADLVRAAACGALTGTSSEGRSRGR